MTGNTRKTPKMLTMEPETDEMNVAFILDAENSGEESDISGFPSSDSSIPSSLCSSELNRTMNEILDFLESEVLVLHGHDIPGINENQTLNPIDNFRRFLPLFLAIKPPKVYQARSIAADNTEEMIEVRVPQNQVSVLRLSLYYVWILFIRRDET